MFPVGGSCPHHVTMSPAAAQCAGVAGDATLASAGLGAVASAGQWAAHLRVRVLTMLHTGSAVLLSGVLQGVCRLDHLTTTLCSDMQ